MSQGYGTPTPSIVTVPVASAWASKINWTQFIGTGLSVVTWAVGILPPQYAVFGPLIIQGAQSLATWYLRTYQTTTITPASLKSIGGGI